LLGSPLSGWILERFHLVGGHAGWQWVFVLEALPTLPLAIGVKYGLTTNSQTRQSRPECPLRPFIFGSGSLSTSP